MSSSINASDDINGVLPPAQMILFGLQHVLAMAAGAVAVPLMIGETLGLAHKDIIFLINADLFVAGIATILQSIGFKNILGAKIPAIEGTSFATVSAMLAIGASSIKMGYSPEQSLTFIFGAVLCAGLTVIILSPVFGSLLRFFPKVVTGSVVTIIGLSLIPVAIRWTYNGTGAPQSIFMALFVLVTILLLMRFLPGVWANMAIIFGLIIGTIVSAFLGMTDFSTMEQVDIISLNTPFHFGFYRFDLTAIISLLLVTLVIMTEETGNISAIHDICDKKLEAKTLSKGLRTSGLSTMLASVFNTFPHTIFGQNVGLLNLTGVKSRFVTATAGLILILCGIFPKFGSLVACIPSPVLGGAGFAMFGMVIAGGITSLGKVNYQGNKNNVIVAVSIGLSMIPTVIPHFYDQFPQWVQTIFHSGITTGCIAAILLNIFFNECGSKNKAL